YIHNGFKVGPNYHKPPAPVAQDWIDSSVRALPAFVGAVGFMATPGEYGPMLAAVALVPVRADLRLRRGPDDLSQWWKNLRDPVTGGPDRVLENLICTAYNQN